MYTSNEDGDDKPWKKSDTRKDHATLSLTVNYTIPADPPCVKDAKEEEKAVLCDLFVSHAADAFGVCYVRVFEKLSLSVTGKLGVSLRLIDLADAADKGFFGGLRSVAKKVAPLALKFANVAGLTGVSAEGKTAELVKEVEAAALAENSYAVWNRDLKGGTAIMLSTRRHGGSYVLLPGFYVISDNLDLEGHTLEARNDRFRVIDPRTKQRPSSNYLVFQVAPWNPPA